MIRDHAEQATNDIIAKCATLPGDQREQVRKIIEHAIIASVREAVQHCRDAATNCCGKDSAMIKHIREEIASAETALIANLSGMR